MATKKQNGNLFYMSDKIFLNSIWNSAPENVKVWVWLLGKAKHPTLEHNGIKVKYGQVLTSLLDIGKMLQYDIGGRKSRVYKKKFIWDMLQRFIKEEMIETKKVSTGILITIDKYEQYQGKEVTISKAKETTIKRFNNDWYDNCIYSYNYFKGVESPQYEKNTIKGLLKVLFIAGYLPEDIIALMSSFSNSDRDCWSEWSMWSIKKYMPMFVAGKMKFTEDEPKYKKR